MIVYPMRPCTPQDFFINGEQVKEESFNGLCPDMGNISLKNKYNDKERTSFSL